jgi:hypothetical protein
VSNGLQQLGAATMGLTPSSRKWKPRDFARFVLDGAAQDTLTAGPTATDAPHLAQPGANDVYPQSLRLSVEVRATVDLVANPLRCRPLFAGRLIFIGGAGSSKPAAADVSRAGFAGWNTTGTLLVELVDTEVEAALRKWAPLLDLVPNRMWYSPVRITESFLFDVLPRLVPTEAPPGSGGALSAGHRQKISEFLGGTWGPVLKVDKNSTRATNDHVAATWMPQFVLDANRRVEIVVTAARTMEPRDGQQADLDGAVAGVAPTHPAHARNGALPARLVYRALAVTGHLLDAGSTRPAAVATLSDHPDAAAVRYFPIRFTRIWKPEADCSTHFPHQTVALARPNGPAFLSQRLAAHGLLYVGLNPAQHAAGTSFQISLINQSGADEHELWWLDGTQTNAWRLQAGIAPVTVDVAAATRPHIALRRRMKIEVPLEPRDTPGEDRCTYLSLRRSMRALVNNRIAGGRLNFGRTTTSDPTRALIDDAWRSNRAFFATARRQLANELTRALARVTPADIVSNNRPLPSAVPGRALWLRPVLMAFFPGDVPAQNIGNSTHRARVLSGGEVAYVVWQTIVSTIQASGTKRNFSDDVIGRGAAGALVLTGLASAYHLDPPPLAGTLQAYVDSLVVQMTNGGLEPGAAAQFWRLKSDFDNIKGRTVPATGVSRYGHSPVFLRVEGTPPTNIVVIDQFGESDCAINGVPGSRVLAWSQGEEIWIAANWSE